MIAAREAWQAGLFGRAHWRSNLASGVLVGVVALPLAMGFAIASGARPEQGIYTAIIAGLVVSVAGGSRLQIAGPTGAFVVILAGITAQYGIDGLQVATLMAGLMLVALGLARLGGIIRFIPDPVITGFTAGIGVIIFVGQWRYFFGLPPPAAGTSTRSSGRSCRRFPQLHWPTTALAPGRCSPSARAAGARPEARARSAARARAGDDRCMACSTAGVATIGSEFGGIPARPARSCRCRSSPCRDSSNCSARLHDRDAGRDRIAALRGRRRRHGRHPARFEPGADRPGAREPGRAAVRRLRRHRRDRAHRHQRPQRRHRPARRHRARSSCSLLVLLLLAPLASDVPLGALAAMLFVVAWNMSDCAISAAGTARAARRRRDPPDHLRADRLRRSGDGGQCRVILAMFQFLRRMSSAVEVGPLGGAELDAELVRRGWRHCRPA